MTKLLRAGSVCELEVENWTDFRQLADDFRTSTPIPTIAYLFRGQANAAWPLRTTLSRLCDHVYREADERSARQLEDIALREFDAQAFQFLPPWTVPNEPNLVDRLVIMQHYGAPTRLLDWTVSPYVAAYFAVVENPQSSGAVWSLHAYTMLRAFEARYPEAHAASKAQELDDILLRGEPPSLMVYRPRIETDRMSAQQTCFTYSPTILPCLGEIARTALTPDDGGDKLMKIVIPGTLKTAFLRELHTLNITARSLFPGADGLGRSIAELARIQQFPERGLPHGT